MRHEKYTKTTGTKPRVKLALAAMLLFAGAVAGCNRQAQQKQPDPPQVIVAKPERDAVTDYEEFTGHTEAVNSVTVRAMVTGRLETVCFVEGAPVAEGDKLFLIDDKVFQAQYEQSVANLALARAHLRRLEADLRRAKALLPTKAISQEDYDKTAGDRDEAAATVDVALAARNSAEENLKYTTVRAKVAGRVSRQMVDPGNMVRANDTALTTIVSTNRMYIYFDVDERTAIRIRRLIDQGKFASTDQSKTAATDKDKTGLADQGKITVNYGLADEDGFPKNNTADVNFVDNQIDGPTGTWRLRAVIEKPDPWLLPNMFLRVRVPIGKPYDALLVPERALGSDQGQKFLYVVDDENKAVYTQVTCGPLRGDKRAIISGLKSTDRFVVTGLQRVKAGDAVDPQEEKAKEQESKDADAPPAAPAATAQVKTVSRQEVR